MKITLLTNWDSASAHALTILAPSLSTFDVTVFYTHNEFKKAPTKPESLLALGRFDEQKLIQSKSIFDHFNAKKLNDINGSGFIEFRESKPDLVISIRHMSILKSAVISIPALGVINLHSGILPNYQGVMATFWAMKNNEEEIGTTLHFVEDARIDTGAIIALSKQATQFDKSYFDNTLSVYQSGCKNIINAINKLNHGGSLSATPQSGASNYFSFPSDTDFDQFEWSLF
jgi:methionyl-tRNA formyltransferase